MVRKLDLLKKFGSEEAVSEYYRGLQKKSMQSPVRKKPGHHGGFQTLKNTNPERLKELQRKGRETQRELRQRTKDSRVDNDV